MESEWLFRPRRRRTNENEWRIKVEGLDARKEGRTDGRTGKIMYEKEYS